MNKIDECLRAFWISKLGVDRLDRLQGGSTDQSPQEKGLSIMGQLREQPQRFYDLMLEGFDGYFHQSVYARTFGKKSMAGPLAELPIGKSQGDVEWWAQFGSTSKGRTRVLAGARKRMEFLSETDKIVRHTVAVPVLAEALHSRLQIRVLTVQSTVTTWSDLLGVRIRRILTPVIDNELADMLFNALKPLSPGLGDMHDLSAQAVELMKDTDRVHTFSGTFGVRLVGRTRHASEGGQLGRRRPLHVVMPQEFEELISAERIRHCEIEIQDEWNGLPRGTAVVLYPMEGKIIFRRMLGVGVINDFLAYLAR